MFKIKSSFADCLNCELFECYSCILDTNCTTFDEVDVIFIAENPGKTEVEHEPPIPLIGVSGQLFRKYFKVFGLDKAKYLITNVVLCQTLLKDGTTGNPSEKTIEMCKVNCFEVIKHCNPKLIVLMGGSAAKAFDLFKKGDVITQCRGNMYKWNGIDVLLTYHPSYANRNKKVEEPKFEADIKRAAEIVGTMRASKEQAASTEVTVGNSGVFHYSIPDKFYTSDYKLVDVQYLTKTNEVLYIFRDKDNNKIYHKENDLFVCYQNPDPSTLKPIVPYDKLNQIKIPYRGRSALDNSYYESDVKITVKHTQDYYMTKKEEEPLVPMNTMYIDIETLQQGDEFSTVDNADDIIAMIGYWYHGKHITYVLDPAVAFKDSSKKVIEECVVCKTEKEVVNKFIHDLKELDPDIITGWYADGFDLPYIINRCRKIGINPQTMSKFGEVEIEYATGRIHITGFIVLDLLFLYQSYTYVRQESYTLDFIGNLELGEGKLGKGYNFSSMFFNDPDEAVRYNRQDVAILPKLDNKLKHIAFQNEVRKVCKCDFNASRSSLGQLDSLIVSFLKQKGLGSKASEMGEKTKFEGAFVKEPIAGIHNFLVDLDATSLYPSTIITYNLGLNTLVMKFDDFTLGYNLSYDMNNLPEKFDVIIDPTFEKKRVTITKEQLIKKITEEDLIYTINGCFLKTHEKEKSFYSEILEFLLQSRKDYKKMMFEHKKAGNEEQRSLYDQRQNAMKIIANSLYGILGNNVYRFFNTDLARAITLGGQELLKNCIIKSENYIKSLKGAAYEEPELLTKQEMYTEHFVRNCEHIITCDTDSLFVTFDDFINKEKDDDEIVKDIGDLTSKVQTFINKEIIPTICSKHNVKGPFSKLEFKNELVMKRGLFLAKKRYAVHVVSQEGVKCDDMVIKGIEIRRSDYPSHTKEKLKELIEMVLKSKKISIIDIMNFVKVHEKEIMGLIRQGNITVARPVTYTKKFEDYKVISQGVKGMKNYNDIEYNVFSKGAKGYLFKLKGIDLDQAPKEVVDKYEKYFTSKGKKLEEIVIPEVLGHLPSYYLIDTKAMLKFSWLDRCELLLGPITQVKSDMIEFSG